MSVEQELETLFVRIKVDAADLAYSRIKSQVDNLSAEIAGSLEDAAKIRPSFLMGKESVAQLNAMALKIKQILDGAMQTIGSGDSASQAATRFHKLTEAVNSLSQATVYLKASQNEIDLTTQAINNLALAGFDMAQFATRFTMALDSLKQVTPQQTAGLAAFGNDIGLLVDKLKLVGGISGLGPQLKAFITDIAAVANDPKMKVTPANIKGLFDFALAVQRINNAFSGSAGNTAGLSQFVSNIRASVKELRNLGSTPQLVTLASNAKSATINFIALNTQLGIYVAYMKQISSLKVRMPTVRQLAAGLGAGSGGGGGGYDFGGQGAGPFGFDPIRRGLSMITSLGTSLAVGFLGFEMVRQVTKFDDNMTKAMSVLHLSLQQHRLRLGQDMNQMFDAQMLSRVRGTVETDILNLSRRGVQTAEDLTEAFAQLSAKGFGTERLQEAMSVVQQFATVGSMAAADSARELATIQSQLGLASNDALQNARNLRYVADVITQGAMVSGMSTEVFLQSLQRLNPHVRSLNQGLEESVSLLASFGRIDPATALSRSQALLRAITSQFIRSEEGPAGRVGARVTDLRTNARPFRMGMGVQPVHMLTDSVRTASQAWSRLGIEVFNTEGEFAGVANTIRQIDAATRHLSAEGREQVLSQLFPGQLRSTATDAIRALLSSSEAMEALSMAAYRADGVLDQVANERLQSFNSQMGILKNNLIAVGVEVGKTLVPVLREVNYLVIGLLDAWWDMDSAGRVAVMTLAAISLSLVAMRFSIPVLVGLFRLLLLDTIVSTGQMIMSTVLGTWGLLIGTIRVLASVVEFLIFVFTTLNTSAMATYAAMAIVASGANIVLKVTIWALNAALATMSVIITYVLAITGLIIISIMILVALVVALIAVIAILAVVAVAAFILIAGWALILIHHLGGFRAVWGDVTAWGEGAFWRLAGFLENFKDNMNKIMTWMDNNWHKVFMNIGLFAENVFNNVMINTVRMTERMRQSIADLFIPQAQIDARNRADTQRAADAATQAVIAARAANPNITQAQMAAIRHSTMQANLPAHMRDLRSIAEGQLIALDALALNTTVSPETREMLQNMFSRPRIAGEAGREAEDVASRVGTAFREISLRRFVLEGTTAPEDARREELIEAQRQTELLRLIAERLGVPLMMGAPGFPGGVID